MEDREKAEKEKKKSEMENCQKTWLATLAFFKQPRGFLLPAEVLMIWRSIQENGEEAVELALLGARYEPAGDRFIPCDHVNLARILTKDKEGNPRIQRFMGLGIKARQAGRAREARESEVSRARETMASNEGPEHADPARVRALIAKAFGTKGVA